MIQHLWNGTGGLTTSQLQGICGPSKLLTSWQMELCPTEGMRNVLILGEPSLSTISCNTRKEKNRFEHPRPHHCMFKSCPCTQLMPSTKTSVERLLYECVGAGRKYTLTVTHTSTSKVDGTMNNTWTAVRKYVFPWLSFFWGFHLASRHPDQQQRPRVWLVTMHALNAVTLCVTNVEKLTKTNTNSEATLAECSVLHPTLFSTAGEERKNCH